MFPMMRMNVKIIKTHARCVVTKSLFLLKNFHIYICQLVEYTCTKTYLSHVLHSRLDYEDATMQEDCALSLKFIFLYISKLIMWPK